MSRIWFWVVGMTLFILTFAYQNRFEPQSFAGRRTEAARRAVVQAADVGGIAGLLRRVGGLGPNE